MKAEDFISYFDGSKSEIILREKYEDVSEVIKLNKENFRHKGQIFISNFTFHSPFILKDIQINHISFKKCIFKAGLSFEGIKCNDIEILECDINSLEFNKCQSHRYMPILENKIGLINIYNYCEFGLVNISGNKNISIFYISQSNLSELNFVKNESVSSINLIEKSNITKVTIKQNQIEHNLTVNEIENNQLLIDENHFNKYFKISGIKFSEIIEFKNNTTNDYCSLETNNTTTIRLTGGSNASGLLITQGPHHTEPCIIKLDCNDDTKGRFSFIGLSIKSFQLIGTIRNAEINLDSLKVASLSFRGVNNYGQITLSDIHSCLEKSKIILYRSTLGNLTLFNCNLDEFNSIEVDSVHLTNLKAIQTKWFNPSKLNNEENLATTRVLLNREIYRQLKLAMTAQADNVQALEFKNLEMAEYMKELKTKPIRNWKEFSDLVLMFLNRSNSYGVNWIKPALLAIFYTAFCYLVMSFIYYLNNPQIMNPECGNTNNFLMYTWQNKTRFFQLLDPTFRLSEVFGYPSNLTFGLYAWATILKIGVAYLVFQTIAAFRKYLK